ncbi:MAG: MBL fold metallo-hydrolase [Brevinemataceae bacterium]
MEVLFWGVRGSIPTPEIDKIKTGGHTTCVEIRLDNNMILIIDAGTGIIPLGKKLHKEFYNQSIPRIHLLLTHTHWDHLYGFPFFALNFVEGSEIDVFGPVKTNTSLEKLILTEMDFEYCPIRYNQLPARINFIEINEGRYTIAPHVVIEAVKHLHPGGCYSYRIEADGKIFVFNTDVEHYPTQLDDRVIRISQDADLMVHDAQYRHEELERFIGWGHSSWNQAVEVANQANVKKLGLTHHDPETSDSQIDSLEREVQKEFHNSFFCREGMSIIL